MYKVLVCDDEKDIVSALKIYLTSDGYNVFEANNGKQAVEVVENEEIHLVLMDIMMPVMDGIQAMVKIREKSNVPVILLTAKGEDTDKVLGLTVGADDYVTKPFGTMELIARVKALLRRTAPAADERVYTLGKLSVNPSKHIVTLDGTAVNLTLKEFELLSYLFKNQGNVLTRDQILQEIWGYEFDGENRTVDVHIRTLRSKLGECGELIETVRGIGYRIGGSV
jgi:two-component system alkaline phosphatase synthesis response regulator PhoP